jgi:molybdate/tungstate transport system substrate-binding protein
MGSSLSTALRGALTAALALVASSPAAAQRPGGPLVVYNAGSLAKPFGDVLRAFAAKYPGVQPQQENSGSVEAVRKLTELGKIPDILGVADYGVIPKLLVPAHATWWATFAKNSMVVVYTDESAGAKEINGANWWQVLLRPDVRWGRANPALDPNGYRTLMVFQLAERHYGQPGLAARLERASPPRFVRPKEADLTALVQSGELDYAWSYYSIAKTAGLRFVNLPADVNLGDPTKADVYAHAAVKVPASRAGTDSIEFRGEPIVYAFTIPLHAPHPETAAAFVRFLTSAEGQAILSRDGLVVIAKPELGGPGKPPAGLF